MTAQIDDGSDLGRYDYASLMHYGERTFAVDYQSEKAVVGHLSRDAPALAAIGPELHMLHIGQESNDIWHSWTTDGALDGTKGRRAEEQGESGASVFQWSTAHGPLR